FPADRLQRADLVRQNLLETTVDDLIGTSNVARKIEPASVPEPPVIFSSPEPVSSGQPRPWGFWTTLGLTAAVLLAGVAAQVAAVVVWVIATGAHRHTNFTEKLESNGLLLTLATWFSTPVVVALVYLFARLRVGPNVR